jgi:hypothetical protein
VKQKGAAMRESKIKAIRDAAVSGYASAFSCIKPWLVLVDGKRLVDKSGRPRRFSTEAAAMAAARRSIT